MHSSYVPRALPVDDVSSAGTRAAAHRLGAVVVAGYLVAAAAAAVAAQWSAVPRWLALHLLLLGAVSNAVLIWSRHFAQALLHSRNGSPRWAQVRLVALNAGVLAVLVGITASSAPVVAVGAGLVSATALWHAGSLALMAHRSTLSGRLRVSVGYYVASAVALSVGAALGALLGTGASNAAGVHLAHVHANLLGWVGLAVLGTLFMLWPAVLRTRMADSAPQVARRVLPVVASGLTVTVAALALMPEAVAAPVAAAGLAVYLVGVVLSLSPFLDAVRRKHPQDAPAWMLAAATGWLVVALVLDAVALARGSGPALAALDVVVPVLVVGLAGQVLVGALTFLLPVTLGGGPAGNRRISAVLQLGWVARTVLLNAGVVGLAVAPGGLVQQAAAAVALLALGSAVPLVLWAVLLSRGPVGAPAPAAPAARSDWTEQVAVGSVLAVLAALTLVAAPASAGPVTGEARTVQVALTDFAVEPSLLEVPAGTRLVLEVRNDGQARHDLRVDGGRATPVLAPGRSATLDLGVVRADLDGWCTLAGHRAAGMELRIAVAEGGAGGAADAPPDHAHDHGRAAAGGGHGPAPDASAPAPTFEPFDANLAPAPGAQEHHVTLRVQETDVEVAPGRTQRMWTFGGTVPGPTLRGKVGDLFVVTLVNDGSIEHSIDFHASRVAPDALMKPVPPGGRLVYAFRAEHAGAWLYHCSTAPMIQHVAMGMYGAVVIDPPDLDPVDRELLLVQSEVWLAEGDELPAVSRMTDADEDLVVFNGRADQYADAPIEVSAGDRVRLWVVNAGPSSSSAFHVVGTQFDAVYEEGRYALRSDDPERGGAQVLDVPPGAGGFAELVVPAPGSYPVVTHRLADAARGATGLLLATP